MNYLSLLNTDIPPRNVLLRLMRYLQPGDRFNLALSGALGGTKLGNYEHVRISVRDLEFGSCPEKRLEIISLKIDDGCPAQFAEASGLFDFMREEIARNIRLLDVANCGWLLRNQLTLAICSMTHLEELYIAGTYLDLDTLADVFQHCAQIKKLSFSLKNEFGDFGWNDRQVQLRNGFQRLNCLKLTSSCRRHHLHLIQKILMWCEDGAQICFEDIQFWNDEFSDSDDPDEETGDVDHRFDDSEDSDDSDDSANYEAASKNSDEWVYGPDYPDRSKDHDERGQYSSASEDWNNWGFEAEHSDKSRDSLSEESAGEFCSTFSGDFRSISAFRAWAEAEMSSNVDSIPIWFIARKD